MVSSMNRTVMWHILHTSILDMLCNCSMDPCMNKLLAGHDSQALTATHIVKSTVKHFYFPSIWHEIERSHVIICKIEVILKIAMTFHKISQKCWWYCWWRIKESLCLKANSFKNHLYRFILLKLMPPKIRHF